MKQEPRQLPSYPLRLEPETRATLEAIAKANGRSLNAQIVMMLESALQSCVTQPDTPPLGEDDVRRIALELIREELAKGSK